VNTTARYGDKIHRYIHREIQTAKGGWVCRRVYIVAGLWAHAAYAQLLLRLLRLLHQPPAGRITSPHRAPAGYLHGNTGALSISGASEVTTLRRCTNLLIITTLIIFYPR